MKKKICLISLAIILIFCSFSFMACENGNNETEKLPQDQLNLEQVYAMALSEQGTLAL